MQTLSVNIKQGFLGLLLFQFSPRYHRLVVLNLEMYLGQYTVSVFVFIIHI